MGGKTVVKEGLKPLLYVTKYFFGQGNFFTFIREKVILRSDFGGNSVIRAFSKDNSPTKGT